jgi:hypothetical protein
MTPYPVADFLDKALPSVPLRRLAPFPPSQVEGRLREQRDLTC